MLTFGSVTSGGTMMLGSMVSLGFGLLTTAIGGVNCRSDCFGKRAFAGRQGRPIAATAAAAHRLLLGAPSSAVGAKSIGSDQRERLP